MPTYALKFDLNGPEVVDQVDGDDVKDGDLAAGGNKNQKSSDAGSACGMRLQSSTVKSAVSDKTVTNAVSGGDVEKRFTGESSLCRRRGRTRSRVTFDPRESIENIENCVTGQVPDDGHFSVALENHGNPAPKVRTGYMLKKRPTRVCGECWQVRYFVLQDGMLSWWRVNPNNIDDSTEPWCGLLDLSLHDCRLVVDSEEATRLSIEPTHGSWSHGGQFTGVAWGRVFNLDTALPSTGDETIDFQGRDASRDLWAASIKEHIRWGRMRAMS